ncbi:MAG TPA: mechanosensitive ion channel domain-containing protein [Hanamia sp.]
MKLYFLVSLFALTCVSTSAQVKDTIKAPKKSWESSLFSNDDTLTRNDYLMSIERMFQALNKASLTAQPLPVINAMNERMDEDDTAISIIKQRLNSNNKGLNIRNVQMFTILLGQIHKDTKEFASELHVYDSTLDSIKRQIFDLRKDTVIRHIFKDSLLRASFKPQLQQLRGKWKKADSLIKYMNVLIDNTLARTSDNLISTDELQLQAISTAQITGDQAFGKERNYLWEQNKPKIQKSFSAQFKNTVASEKKITQYYFSHTHNQLLLLFLTGLVFFFWLFFNFRSLKKREQLDLLQPFHFRYINTFPVFASLIFMLNLAPLFDLNAPIVYVELIEFLLMIALTVYFRKRLPGNLFFFWIFFILLFLVQAFSKYLGLPFYLNRWLSFILNSASFILGVFALLKFKKHYSDHKVLFLTVVIFTFFNLLAILCNLFGRVTLMQIFSSTGTYSLIQTVGLIVFVQAITEAFLLQIQCSRVRKDYKENFDHAEVAKGISRAVTFFAVIIWLIVFTTNLNVYQLLSFKIMKLLSTSHTIGSFSFTLGGIILFLAILWIANFLQKYIAYFFGDVGDDSSFNNKSQRSRLMITRLVLLVAGFLLAVVASGLPIDRITVILGALSVGIGLGLQNIVNNFVSGIILIFDRTLRIGDTVEIGDKKGRVKEITMRSSTLLTAEGAEVIIPNGDILSHNFVNWSLSNNYIRIDLTFNIDKLGISDETRKAIIEIIQSSPQVLAQKDPEIFINTITSQSTQLKIYFWCMDVNKSEEVRSQVYGSVSKQIEEKGIKIL